NRFARDADPFAAAHLVCEGIHLVEHTVHFGDDIDPIDDQAGSLRIPECGVQHRSVLSGVDVFAGQHRFSAIRQADLIGKINQGAYDVGIDQVLGEVDVEVT